MKKDKKNDDAMNFLNSMRGHYIISQALYIAIEELDKVTDFKHRQTSNMQDEGNICAFFVPIFGIKKPSICDISVLFQCHRQAI